MPDQVGHDVPRHARLRPGICILAILLLGWLFCLPRDLFKGVSYSTVVESADGELLGARIAEDGQWRFPPCDTVPRRFATALIQFEDRHFRLHPGVNPVSLVRAAVSNVRSGHVVSGGSTITMQVIRLSRRKERTIWQKMMESVLATRLELRYSKRKILALYASHAPFGGNVVGLEAASWRYFGRPASELSWSESAMLAVLPNAPSSIHPGRGRDELLQKRNRLLKRLLEHGDISSEIYEASCEEPLPDEPLPLPSFAVHYVERFPKGVRTRTGISLPLQKAVEEAVNRRSDELAKEGIADMAAVVMDNATGKVVAYVGNSSPERERPGRQVDIASSPRSTGSILKPFLYAAAVQEGTILPRTLLTDIPVNLGGFAPQNFDRQFYGAVHADEALARSLNVPSVFLLRQYGVPKFYSVLQQSGLSTLRESPDHYGLSLILGGAEARLDEITAAYSSFVRGEAPFTDPLARWYTYEALKEVNRPDQLDWRLIRSVRKAAWKTGTSYGFRDAWAVGMTPSYTIGVWAGNAQGQGTPGLVGARTAGPVLFDILNLLPPSVEWFSLPESGVWADVCEDSGHLAGPQCPAVPAQLPGKALDSAPCPYHESGEFVLPPAQEWYYRQNHPEYTGAKKEAALAPIQFIYPQNGAVLALPRQLSGKIDGLVFRVAHHRQDATLWWHLDDNYIGETSFRHEMMLSPAPGAHILTVVDQDGASAAVRFTIAR